MQTGQREARAGSGPSAFGRAADLRPDGAARIDAAQPADEARVVEAIVQAFSADPAARWMYPEASEYRAHFPAFVRAFGGAALACGSAHLLGEGSGAALWLPPGVHPDDGALMGLVERSVPAERRSAVFEVFEAMARYHPEGPHWHLALIGVRPALQGQGLGSALIRHGLRICDEERLPAYLESSNPANIPLYRRHGFEVVGTIRAGSSPPITPMLRPAR